MLMHINFPLQAGSRSLLANKQYFLALFFRFDIFEGMSFFQQQMAPHPVLLAANLFSGQTQLVSIVFKSPSKSQGEFVDRYFSFKCRLYGVFMIWQSKSSNIKNTIFKGIFDTLSNNLLEYSGPSQNGIGNSCIAGNSVQLGDWNMKFCKKVL